MQYRPGLIEGGFRTVSTGLDLTLVQPSIEDLQLILRPKIARSRARSSASSATPHSGPTKPAHETQEQTAFLGSWPALLSLACEGRVPARDDIILTTTDLTTPRAGCD